MNDSSRDLELARIPSDLICASIEQAERDAESAVSFLTDFYAELGHAPPWKCDDGLPRPSPYSVEFFMQLAAALRLLSWEANDLHRDYLNVPEPEAALHEVLLNAAIPDCEMKLFHAVQRATFDFFSWSAPTTLGAQVLIAPSDDELLASAIATFLWNDRNAKR
jgi:hypothetical protein